MALGMDMLALTDTACRKVNANMGSVIFFFRKEK
jgi:hypothetical protein